MTSHTFLTPFPHLPAAGAKKPVVASMGDVAASGGYYMSMGCKTIVAEPLTITGRGNRQAH